MWAQLYLPAATGLVTWVLLWAKETAPMWALPMAQHLAQQWVQATVQTWVQMSAQ